MAQQPVDLRPSTRCVLDHLLALGQTAIGLTISVIVRDLSLSPRSVRRAFVELEALGFVIFKRTSTRHKYVRAVLWKAGQSVPRDGPSVPQNGQTGQQNGQTGQQNGQTGQQNGQPILLVNSVSKRDVVDVMRPREAGKKRDSTHKQQRQLLLALTGSADEALLADAGALVGQLEGTVRAVWDRVGKRHGFLLWDDSTLSGLAVAMRRFEISELLGCIEWSAHELAAGRLDPRLFSTTFRGNGFCDRYRTWQARLERIRQQEAEARRRAAEPPQPAPVEVGWQAIGEQAALWCQRRKGEEIGGST